MVRGGLEAIYLSGWQVAAEANLAGADLPRPEPLSRQQRARARAAAEQRAAARRPDRRAEGRDETRLAGADSRRRRGRLRRRAQLVRADEGDDRGRRGRRPLRGPARGREEVRPSRRQGARPDGQFVRTLVAARLAADVLDVPTVLVARTDALSATLLTSDIDPATSRSSPASARARASSASATGSRRRSPARSPTRPTPTCSGSRPRPRTSARRASSPPRCTRQFPGKLLAYNCSPSFNWKRHLDDRDRPLPRELGRARLPVPVHHARRLPLAERRDVRAGTRLRASAACPPTSSCRSASSRSSRTATPRRATSARWARVLRPCRRDRQRRRLLDAGAPRLDRRRQFRHEAA